MAKKAIYLVLDCETATLPFIKELCLTDMERKKIAVSRPIIYDIGWTLFYRDGTILKKASYLVQETFFVPNVFDTAYYREKRPIYMEKLSKGEIKAALWNNIANELLEDCRSAIWVAAFNAQFDYKKAIPFTERYIKALYSNELEKFIKGQKWYITSGKSKEKPNAYCKVDNDHFIFRDEKFDIVDLWRVASNMLNIFGYKKDCAEFPAISNSGMYFKTSAEQAYRYIDKNYSFNEAHTALEDAEIETQILLAAFKKKKKIEKGIMAFPFKILGTTVEFLNNPNFKNRISEKAVNNIISAMHEYLKNSPSSSFSTQLKNQLSALES